MKKFLFSVVIGSFNQLHTLIKVLEGFAHQTLPANKFEVIVVDSSSTDNTSLYCNETEFPFTFRYIRIPNEGKVKARNIGINEASGNWIFLTDADVIPHPFLLEKHLQAQQKFSRDVVIVGQQIVINSLDQIERGKLCFKHRKRPWQRLSWRHLVTGNLSITKSLLVSLGGFAKEFLYYGYEDYELGWRIAKKKIPIIYCPQAINFHYHPITFAKQLPRCYQAGRGAVIFWRKHPSLYLKYHLGINPIATWFYSKLGNNSYLVECLKQKAFLEKRSLLIKLARKILQEIYYHNGIKDELKEVKNTPASFESQIP